MTTDQKLCLYIIRDAVAAGAVTEEVPDPILEDDIHGLFDALASVGALQDSMCELRGGTVETGLPSPSSRCYEGTEVAAMMPDGSWVGWTYWHGGGKHGDPDAIDWIADAYELQRETASVVAEEVTWRRPDGVAAVTLHRAVQDPAARSWRVMGDLDIPGEEVPAHDPERGEDIYGVQTEVTNGDRAERAQRFLEAGLAALGEGHPYEVGDDSCLTDIITDLMHLAHSEERDPLDLICSSAMHFHAEAGMLP